MNLARIAALDFEREVAELQLLAAVRHASEMMGDQPPIVSTSSSGKSVPNTSLNCSISVSARTR